MADTADAAGSATHEHRCLRVLAGLAMLVSVCALVAPAEAEAGPPEPLVHVYGREGSFRNLTGRTSTASGHSVATVAVPGWSFRPGAAAFHAEHSPGGRIVMSTMTMADNQLVASTEGMSVVAFDPATTTAQVLDVPTSTGATTVRTPGEAVGGGDVSDLCLAGLGDQQRLVGVSAVPYRSWRISQHGELPSMLGLVDGPAGLALDPGSTRTASELRASGAAGADAYPLGVTPFGETFAQNRGSGECARLPATGHVVVANYFSDTVLGLPNATSSNGSLAVLSADGRVVAFTQLPDVVDRDGRLLTLAPRDIQAAPAGVPGHERFAVVFDAFDRQTGEMVAFPVQEFAFGYGAIRARSAPVVVDGLRANTTAYSGSTLVVSTSGTTGWGALISGPLAVFAPPTLHQLAPPANRGALPGPTLPVSTEPPARVVDVQPDRWLGATTGMQTLRSLHVDPATTSIVAVGLNGAVRTLDWTGLYGPAPLRCDIDLGGPFLRYPVDPATGQPWRIAARHATIDPATSTLYVPYSGVARPPDPGELAQQDQYLLSLDLQRATTTCS